MISAKEILLDYLGPFAKRFIMTDQVKFRKFAQVVATFPNTPQVKVTVFTEARPWPDWPGPAIEIKTVHHPFYGACDRKIQYLLADPDSYKKFRAELKKFLGDSMSEPSYCKVRVIEGEEE